MVFITEDLVRKRAEHNEYQLSSLEEISLHQQDIEKIEHLDKWCRELKILYLQSNLIPRIENVGRLKKLEYLNLALNNISRIENLGGCESLRKLDFTVNFISELTSVERLKENKLLRELYLTGNPCTQYEGYREYVIATLPQLKQLDGKEIERSERIQATQEYAALRDSILQQQKRYQKKQEKEKEGRSKESKGHDGRWYTDIGGEQDKSDEGCQQEDETLTEEEKEKKYWSQPTSYTPESRTEMHNHIKEQQERKDQQKGKYFENEQAKREIRYFRENGEPMNINTARIDFEMREDEERGNIILDVACYKHLDTSLIDLDVQPKYVRIRIKQSILQLALIEEVNPDKSDAKRSQITGHLVITMPKASGIIKKKIITKPKAEKMNETIDLNSEAANGNSSVKKEGISLADLSNIVKDSEKKLKKPTKSDEALSENFDADFVDDPDVPPLI